MERLEIYREQEQNTGQETHQQDRNSTLTESEIDTPEESDCEINVQSDTIGSFRVKYKLIYMDKRSNLIRK
jgi:hypothetical protein